MTGLAVFASDDNVMMVEGEVEAESRHEDTRQQEGRRQGYADGSLRHSHHAAKLTDRGVDVNPRIAVVHPSSNGWPTRATKSTDRVVILRPLSPSRLERREGLGAQQSVSGIKPLLRPGWPPTGPVIPALFALVLADVGGRVDQR